MPGQPSCIGSGTNSSSQLGRWPQLLVHAKCRSSLGINYRARGSAPRAPIITTRPAAASGESTLAAISVDERVDRRHGTTERIPPRGHLTSPTHDRFRTRARLATPRSPQHDGSRTEPDAAAEDITNPSLTEGRRSAFEPELCSDLDEMPDDVVARVLDRFGLKRGGPASSERDRAGPDLRSEGISAARDAAPPMRRPHPAQTNSMLAGSLGSTITPLSRDFRCPSSRRNAMPRQDSLVHRSSGREERECGCRTSGWPSWPRPCGPPAGTAGHPSLSPAPPPPPFPFPFSFLFFVLEPLRLHLVPP